MSRFGQVQLSRLGAAHNFLRRDNIALSRGVYLHLIVVEEQTRNILQPEYSGRFYLMMAIHHR